MTFLLLQTEEHRTRTWCPTSIEWNSLSTAGNKLSELEIYSMNYLVFDDVTWCCCGRACLLLDDAVDCMIDSLLDLPLPDFGATEKERRGSVNDLFPEDAK
jgi:hypothetical protein